MPRGTALHSELLTKIVNDHRAGMGSAADGVGLSWEWRTPLGPSALPNKCPLSALLITLERACPWDQSLAPHPNHSQSFPHRPYPYPRPSLPLLLRVTILNQNLGLCLYRAALLASHPTLLSVHLYQDK